MQLLFVVRNDYNEIYGGDTVQILKTKDFLEKIFDVHAVIKPFKDIKEYDIVCADIIHMWGINNIQHSYWDKFCNKKFKDKKICISSIFWDVSECYVIKYIYKYLNYIPVALIPFIRALIFLFIRISIEVIPKYRATSKMNFLNPSSALLRKKIIEQSDIIIPNSDEEGELLCKCSYSDIKEFQSKFISIPNAIDLDFIKNHKDNGYMQELKDFVIESAGIEPLKNQLSLLKALYNQPEIPIVFAGQIRNEKYYNELKKLADKRGNVYFTGKISPEDLFSLYKRAKVHVLASFRESPGLATLESLICGSQIVVSDEKYCPIKYYNFDKYGFVCNPYNIQSIRKAVLEAYNKPKDINLPDEYINFFSYETVAKMTYEIYKQLLDK